LSPTAEPLRDRANSLGEVTPAHMFYLTLMERQFAKEAFQIALAIAREQGAGSGVYAPPSRSPSSTSPPAVAPMPIQSSPPRSKLKRDSPDRIAMLEHFVEAVRLVMLAWSARSWLEGLQVA